MDTGTGNVYGPDEKRPDIDSLIEISEEDFNQLREQHLEESRKIIRKMHQQEAKRRTQ